MGRGINKVILVGNLGSDPEVRVGQNSTFANLSIATNEQWKDKSGQQQERTEWHRVTLFGRLAEIARDYLKKGSTVYLEGKIQTRKYNDHAGNTKYTTEIIGNQMQMLGGRANEGGYTQTSTNQQTTSSSANSNEPEIPWDTPGGKAPDWLEEVPF